MFTKPKQTLFTFLLLIALIIPFLTFAQTVSAITLNDLLAQVYRLRAQVAALIALKNQQAAVGSQVLTEGNFVINSSNLIRPTGLGSQDQFATSIALDHNTAFFGAPGGPSGTGKGAAYIANRATAWATTTQKLIAPDGANGHRFGQAVAVDGSWAVVGAEGAGAAYVYELINSTWTYRQKLVASPNIPGNFFGAAMAISGTQLFIGAYGDTSYIGKVFVFNYNGSSWVQTQILSAPDGANYDFFGSALAVSGNNLVVGAYGNDEPGGTNFGSAYLYNFDGTLWLYQQRLQAPDAGSGDNFGESVDIDDGNLVIGASRDDDRGSNAGAAYVFNRSGNTWNFHSKLTGSDSVAGNWFGTSITIKGNVLVVGSPNWGDTDGVTKRGALYPFLFVGNVWQAQPKLLPPAPWGSYDDNFGNAVVINADQIIGGAKMADWLGNATGDAYIYNYAAPTPILTFTLTAPASTGGTITPIGVTTVNEGATQTYIFTPNTNYGISHLLIDNTTQPATTTHTFSNIQANHTVSAVFVPYGGPGGAEPCSITNIDGSSRRGFQTSAPLAPCSVQ